MRVLLTATAFFPAVGGAQLHWHKIGSLLASRGHRVQVVTQWTENRTDWLLGTTIFAPRKSNRFHSEGMEITRIAPGLSSRLAMLPFVAAYHTLTEVTSPALARLFRKTLSTFAKNADLIHNVRIGREYFCWASYEAARASNIPFFITPNISPRMLTTYGKFLVRTLLKLLPKADGVFAFTEDEKAILTDMGVHPDKIEVIGIGPLIRGQPDPSGFARQFGIDGPVVLFLGQKYEYKGYKELLDAAPLVWRRYPSACFVFIGPHYGRSKQILSGARRDRRILDLGADSSTLKASALCLCSIFCLPSRQEGFGGVYTEAWYFAKPVIGCNIPFVRSVIEHGKDGLLVSQNPKEIADAIVHLLDNPEAATQMGEIGRQKVLTKYNWEAITAQVENFYHNRAGACAKRNFSAASRLE